MTVMTVWSVAWGGQATCMSVSTPRSRRAALHGQGMVREPFLRQQTLETARAAISHKYECRPRCMEEQIVHLHTADEERTASTF